MALSYIENYDSETLDVQAIIDTVAELIEGRDMAVFDYKEYRAAKGGEATEAEGIAKWAADNPEQAQELGVWSELLGELRVAGCGSLEWEGDWYPSVLIQNTYFGTYARQLAADLFTQSIAHSTWPFNHIDWERAANDLEQDYSSVNIPVPDGNGEVLTYFYR